MGEIIVRSSMKRLDLIGFGAMNVDLMYRVDRLVVDGQSAIIEHARSGGGSAANTVYALARLGVRTGFVGAVGDDEAGRFLLDDLGKAGADTGHIAIKPGVQTGSVLGLTAQAGGRALYACSGANGKLSSDDIEPGYLNSASILHLSSFVFPAQVSLQRRLLASLDPSVKVSFAPGSLYTRKGLRQMSAFLRRTHILFINRAEIEEMTGLGMQKAAEKCLALGCRIVAVTLGKGLIRRGTHYICYVTSDNGHAWIEGERSDKKSIVDTTGAGDAFAAGFLYGLLKEKSLEECGCLSDIVAGCSLRGLGARAGLPAFEELGESYRRRCGGML